MVQSQAYVPVGSEEDDTDKAKAAMTYLLLFLAGIIYPILLHLVKRGFWNFLKKIGDTCIGWLLAIFEFPFVLINRIDVKPQEASRYRKVGRERRQGAYIK
jgi:hypothetical protein